MFIETKSPAAAGSNLVLRFYLDDGGPIVIASAEARYGVVSLGVGVEFTHVSPAERKRIEAHITKIESGI